MKVIIIGGDAAGMSAASKLKRLDKSCDIVVYEKGSYLSYASCGMPYYLADPAFPKESLIQRTRAEFEAAGIRPLLHHEALRVDPAGKSVLVRNLETGVDFEDTYDRLLIATGAHSVVPEVPGVRLPGVHTLKTVDDAARLREALGKPEGKNVVVIGGGYIGAEVAEALSGSGLSLRMIQRPEHLLKNFDPEIAVYARQELERLGVMVHTSEQLQSITGTGRVQAVVTDRGTYAADVVLLAIGVAPSTGFLRDSGIQLAGNGAVEVDREMRASLPGIYAAGDCAEVYHLVRQHNVYIPLATTANKCGRLAGENLAGGHASFGGTLGSAAIKVGRLELARTGLSEQEARSLGLPVKTVMVEANDLPHYYPGSSRIRLKLNYREGTGRLLGAQGVGEKGVVLRIDVFAAAIAAGMSAGELGMLDLCYAPPFATPWDAVHVAANAAK